MHECGTRCILPHAPLSRCAVAFCIATVLNQPCRVISHPSAVEPRRQHPAAVRQQHRQPRLAGGHVPAWQHGLAPGAIHAQLVGRRGALCLRGQRQRRRQHGGGRGQLRAAAGGGGGRRLAAPPPQRRRRPRLAVRPGLRGLPARSARARRRCAVPLKSQTPACRPHIGLKHWCSRARSMPLTALQICSTCDWPARSAGDGTARWHRRRAARRLRAAAGPAAVPAPQRRALAARTRQQRHGVYRSAYHVSAVLGSSCIGSFIADWHDDALQVFKAWCRGEDVACKVFPLDSARASDEVRGLWCTSKLHP